MPARPHPPTSRSGLPLVLAAALLVAGAGGAWAQASKSADQVVEGAKKIGKGVEETAKGIGKTVTEVADAWAPYLTMTEGIRIAAKAFTTDISKLSCCA